MVNLLTSDPDLVDVDTALNISGAWIPALLNKAIEILNNQSTIPGEDADTVQTIASIANSLVKHSISCV